MSQPGSATKLVAILGGGGLLILLAIFLRPAEQEVMESGDMQPPGRWHLQSARLAGDPAGDEELARVLSLPYISGSQSAPSNTGVTRYDPDRSLDGVNLYVSGHGPEALLVDMRGEILHRWRYPFEKAFPDKQPTIDTAYIRRAHLDPNGDLTAIFQGGGMIKLDRDSRLLWASDLAYYNHLHALETGQILSIAKTARLVPELRADKPILEDAIVLLTSEGEIELRLSLLEAFEESEFAEIIHPLPEHPDIFHTNTVMPIEDTLALSSDLFISGQWLVSLREIDTVAIIDPERATVEAAWRGPWRAQHQPVPLPTGTILLFDNKGGADGSRVLEFDPADQRLTWEFPSESDESLSSPEAGSCQRLANGNTLITESEMGRAMEITAAGQVVWEFVSPHRAGPQQELVATLFEVVRMPFDAVPFLKELGPP